MYPDPDPGGPKTCGSGSGSATLLKSRSFHAISIKKLNGPRKAQRPMPEIYSLETFLKLSMPMPVNIKYLLSPAHCYSTTIATRCLNIIIFFILQYVAVE
jgi:hypothetical protein